MITNKSLVKRCDIKLILFFSDVCAKGVEEWNNKLDVEIYVSSSI